MDHPAGWTWKTLWREGPWCILFLFPSHILPSQAKPMQDATRLIPSTFSLEVGWGHLQQQGSRHMHLDKLWPAKRCHLHPGGAERCR